MKTIQLHQKLGIYLYLFKQGKELGTYVLGPYVLGPVPAEKYGDKGISLISLLAATSAATSTAAPIASPTATSTAGITTTPTAVVWSQINVRYAGENRGALS